MTAREGADKPVCRRFRTRELRTRGNKNRRFRVLVRGDSQRGDEAGWSKTNPPAVLTANAGIPGFIESQARTCGSSAAGRDEKADAPHLRMSLRRTGEAIKSAGADSTRAEPKALGLKVLPRRPLHHELRAASDTLSRLLSFPLQEKNFRPDAFHRPRRGFDPRGAESVGTEVPPRRAPRILRGARSSLAPTRWRRPCRHARHPGRIPDPIARRPWRCSLRCASWRA